MKLSRRDILQKAYDECMTEMYAKAQPSADYNKIIEDLRNGVSDDSQDDPIYQRHYLSHEEFNYIKDKYIDAYGMKEHWHSNIDIIKDYFNGKGNKDKWIPEVVHEDGYKTPGYRSFEKVPQLSEQFKEFVDEETAIKLQEIVLNNLQWCEDYYMFDREADSFSCSVSLGASPTSHKDGVVKYWKDKGVEVNIEDRNPCLFYDADELGDEFEDVMIDEYGEDWKNYWWNFYYNTNDGKKKLVTEWMQDDKRENKFNGHYVREIDGELIVDDFYNEGSEMNIDEFIKKHNIKWEEL